MTESIGGRNVARDTDRAQLSELKQIRFILTRMLKEIERTNQILSGEPEEDTSDRSFGDPND